MNGSLDQHPVVSREEWTQAREALLEQEKAHTREGDRLARLRRELPWVKVEKDYLFQGPDGELKLADLFQGRSQLLIQHFMFNPGWEEGCVGCSFGADHVDPARIHFQAVDVSYAAVSRAPVEKLQAFKKRMSWQFLWVSSGEGDFNYDFHVSFKPESLKGEVYYNYEWSKQEIGDLPGLSVFYRNSRGEIFHTYSTFSRGQECMISTFGLLGLVPKDRYTEEDDSGMGWVRYHDRYASETKVTCCGCKD